MSTVTPAPARTINREWIAAEFSKGVQAEAQMSTQAREHAATPPQEGLGVLYTQIADADTRHREVVETVAVRYGHTPTPKKTGGISETLSRLKDKVSAIGSSALDAVGHDLATKANAIHWYTAWVHTFEEIGDGESARELAGILAEEKSHHDALQDVLNRLVAEGTKVAPIPSTTA